MHILKDKGVKSTRYSAFQGFPYKVDLRAGVGEWFAEWAHFFTLYISPLFQYFSKPLHAFKTTWVELSKKFVFY